MSFFDFTVKLLVKIIAFMSCRAVEGRIKMTPGARESFPDTLKARLEPS